MIFVSSPPTFDPFMVDICLALTYGASLIMTTNQLRCDAPKLLDILFPDDELSETTIMQSTPSLFTRWISRDLANRVFSQQSQLRILAFGGEPFPPTKTLTKWMNWEANSRPRLFNLYGLTEMSCWASIYEITNDDIASNRKIPIGQPLDKYTSFDVTADGELILKSRVRKSFLPQISGAQVTDDEFELTLYTGDVVEIADDTQLYFSSRTNAIVKFFGQKINLSEIDAVARHVNTVADAICIHDEQRNVIVLFVKSEDDETRQRIAKELRRMAVYVKIHCVNEFPLTTHGKVSKKELLDSYFASSSIAPTNGGERKAAHSIFIDVINEIVGTQISYAESIRSTHSNGVEEKKLKFETDSSFVHLGGSSLKAIQVVEEFERITLQSNSHLLPMLLDDRLPVWEIIHRLSNENKQIEQQTENDVEKKAVAKVVPRWKIDMEKCIDAAPSVCYLKGDMPLVSVGSHSKLLYNIKATSGDVVSKIELPDRIESQVIQLDDCGLVGCYDGHLYCFDLQTAAMFWKFSSGAMIKCRALLMGPLVIFGNYNESTNLFCLDATTGKLIWSQRIGTKSIYANPIKINEENVLICTLDGTVALVHSGSADILWTFQLNFPIFSTPSVLSNEKGDDNILIASVNGTIASLSSDGALKWTHQIDGNIFSSLECFESFGHVRFVFGSQNHFAYCFEATADGCVEIWKCQMSASIRSSPVFIRKGQKDFICIFSSDGILRIVNCNDGSLVNERDVGGKVFSTPLLLNHHLFVGSRDNFLYCINVDDLI